MSTTDALTITSAPDALTRYYCAKEREESAVLYINDAYLEAVDALEKLEAENAKLRKLVRDYIDAPCTTCDCWQDEFRCWSYDGADCGLVARARELGVEVD